MRTVHNGVVDMSVFLPQPVSISLAYRNERTQVVTDIAPQAYDHMAIELRARKLRAEWLRSLLKRKQR